jgi:phosphoribosyl 1,2-cyclic phosphodiesterase
METWMSLEFCVLGSGSSGNSTVVRAPQGVFLIDAGFGPRATDQRMAGTGISVRDVSAIVLTHLDHDHFNTNWLITLSKARMRIHLSRSRVKEFLHCPEVRDFQARFDQALINPRLARGLIPIDELIVPFDDELEPVPGVRMRALPLAHDSTGSHGFHLECGGYRAGFATDLGKVPDTLLEAFCGVDFLALESNYDQEMEINSDRPYYLKQRIMGGSGHLSNDQALAAVQAIFDRTASLCGPEKLPRHVVLLHRSRQCNCPKLLRQLFAGDPRIAPVLTLTDQFERTEWLRAHRPRAQHVEQLALAW